MNIMASKHLQQHNIWPLSWATTLWAVTMIFGLGSLHTRFTTLEQNFKEYKIETNESIKELRTEVYNLKVNDNQALTVIDKNNKVLGVATREATLSITPEPTVKPTIRPSVAPSVTKP